MCRRLGGGCAANEEASAGRADLHTGMARAYWAGVCNHSNLGTHLRRVDRDATQNFAAATDVERTLVQCVAGRVVSDGDARTRAASGYITVQRICTPSVDAGRMFRTLASDFAAARILNMRRDRALEC